MLARARAALTLGRWLGPWASPEAVPPGIAIETVTLPGPRGDFEAWLLSPRRRAVGRYLLAPGLHFDGPADPRMRRFVTILAAAGFEVLAPFLPDFLEMRVAPTVIEDLAAAFDWLAARGPERPAVFSISFGSLPALRLAADPARRGRVSRLVCFGGYASFEETLEFCLAGAPGVPRDPLNQPAVFLNLLDHLDGVPADAAPLRAGWMRYLRATWGRPEMKAADAYPAVAQKIAESLPAAQRELFLVGCGALPGGLERCRAALERRGDAAFLDPRPHLERVRCPVTLVHGRDDDVIPVDQAEALARALPPGLAEVLITGLYDHTRPSAGVRQLAGEASTMLRILGAVAGLGWPPGK